MIKDLQPVSIASRATLGRPHSRRSAAPHPSHASEADSISTQFLLYPAAQPAPAFPWFLGVLDGLREPLTKYHE